MSLKSSVFNSVDLDSGDVSDAVRKVAPVGHCGYFLVRGYLIPYSHLHNLAAILQGRVAEYGKPIDPYTMFSDVWNEFSDIERKVMGECLMILIENKKVPICFPDEVVDEHFWDPRGKGGSFVTVCAINCDPASN